MVKYYKDEYKDGTCTQHTIIDLDEYTLLTNDIGLRCIGASVCYMDCDSVTVSKDGFTYSTYTVDTPKRHRQVMAIYDGNTNRVLFKVYSETLK